MTDYWLDMLEVLTPIKIYTAPGMDYNIDRCRGMWSTRRATP